MSLKRPKWAGGCSWSISSKKDPRFNASGTGTWGEFIATGQIPGDVEDVIKETEQKLGTTRPDDIELSAFSEDRGNDGNAYEDHDGGWYARGDPDMPNANFWDD
jgi:hypothetical protein